jgi:catechol 2,3-dioxygenase-like lactoylglutathione lyase family enzyme
VRQTFFIMRILDRAFVAWGCMALALLLAAIASAADAPGIAAKPDMNPMQLAIDHASASVADLDKESEWYQRVFGMQVINLIKVSDERQVLQLGIPGFTLHLVKQKGSTRTKQMPGNTTPQGWLHIVFRTPEFDAAYKRLQALQTDVTITRVPDGSFSWLTLHDPEGNEIEVVPLSSPVISLPKTGH